MTKEERRIEELEVRLIWQKRLPNATENELSFFGYYFGRYNHSTRATILLDDDGTIPDAEWKRVHDLNKRNGYDGIEDGFMIAKYWERGEDNKWRCQYVVAFTPKEERVQAAINRAKLAAFSSRVRHDGTVAGAKDSQVVQVAFQLPLEMTVQ
jgi:hypothetical protein